MIIVSHGINRKACGLLGAIRAASGGAGVTKAGVPFWGALAMAITRLASASCSEPWCERSQRDWGARMNRWLVLLGFLVVAVGGGLAIGYLTAPGQWYAGLDKPSFNPPNWIFGPVWTVLYVLIAVAGWSTFERDRRGWPMRLWWAQLALNFLWSPVFFAAHRIGLALAIVLLMLAAILAFIVIAWRQDRLAAWLFAPYAAWVSFASILNAAIYMLN